MRTIIIAIFSFCLLGNASPAWSAGAAAKRKRNPKMMQQQLMQQKMMQQRMLRQKAQSAAQQAVYQNRQQIKQNVAAEAAKQTIVRELILAEVLKQKKILKYMAEKIGQAALQKELARQQRIAQYMTQDIAEESLRQLLGTQNKILQDMAAQLNEEILKEELARQNQVLSKIEEASAQESAVESAQTEEVAEVVQLSDIWKSFETSSEAWTLMMDTEPKVVTVAKYIQDYQKQGIIIRRPPEFYASTIDSMTETSPDMLKQPFPQILQIVAIIYYDFDNGKNKDAMALEVLGKESFEQNKKRLGL